MSCFILIGLFGEKELSQRKLYFLLVSDETAKCDKLQSELSSFLKCSKYNHFNISLIINSFFLVLKM